MRVSRIGVVSSVAVLLLGLGGCGGSDDDGDSGGSDPTGSAPADTSTETPLFPDDFEPVCEGATVSAATAYDKSATSHKALYFASYEEDLLDQSSRLPADWTVTFAATGNPLQAVDLVLCAVRTADKLVRTCTGYQDDGVDTGNEVRWHTATYDVSVREATTGTVLTSKTLEATDKDCPSFVTFNEGEETIDDYAEVPDNRIVAVLKPFVQP